MIKRIYFSNLWIEMWIECLNEFIFQDSMLLIIPHCPAWINESPEYFNINVWHIPETSDCTPKELEQNLRIYFKFKLFIDKNPIDVDVTFDMLHYIFVNVSWILVKNIIPLNFYQV